MTEEIFVPSLWRVERCTKHANYESDCLACREEILTLKTENAYKKGFEAGLKAKGAGE